MFSVYATPGRPGAFSRLVERVGNRLMDQSEEVAWQLMTNWHTYTIQGLPVDTGHLKSTVTSPHRAGPGVLRFEITANYAVVVEYGGYRGVGPKTAERPPETLPGAIVIGGGIFATQVPSAPLRRAKSRVKMEIAAILAPTLLRMSGFRGFRGFA